VAIRSWLLVGVLALGAAACASIVGLDDSDPASNTSNTNGADLDGGITTEAGVSLSTGRVVFQKVACGIAQTQTIKISSSSATPTAVQVSLPPDPVFSLEKAQNGALSFTLAPHATESFTIAAKNPVSGTSSADVLVKVGAEEHHILVSLETAGGNLSFDPASLDFGQIRLNATSERQKVVFRNDGTDKVKVTGFTGAADFAVVDSLPALPFDLEPGATVEKEVQMLPGATATALLSEDLVPTADGLCAGPPKLTLKGQRLDAPFTVNPQAVDFGDLDCGTPAPTPKTITVSNYTAKERPIALANTSAAFTATASPGSLAAAPDPQHPTTATVTISVPAPPQVPADYNDTLTVTVDGTPITVPLHVRVRGALFDVSPPTLSLRRTSGASGTGKATLTNKGNVTACVKYTTSDTTFISEDFSCNGYNCYITDDTDQVNAGTGTDWTVKYFSGTTSTVTITANLARCGYGSTVPLCGPVPQLTVSSN
jgi:hypothetical protein